jgi:hypothetical protein
MKRIFLQVAKLALVGMAVVLQAGCPGAPGGRVLGADQAGFKKTACYLTTITDGPNQAVTVTASDTLVCSTLVGQADHPEDTTDVEKK